MTGAELKTIRESLLMSAQGLADRLARDGLLPVGHVRTVQRWEEGARPVPDDISAAVQGLDQAVENIARHSLAMIRSGIHPPGAVVLLRYESAEDFARYHQTDTGGHDYRLHLAALARLRRDAVALGTTIRIISMVPEHYEAWRFQAGLEDDPGSRATWAAQHLAAEEGGRAGIEGFIRIAANQIKATALRLTTGKGTREELHSMVAAACDQAAGLAGITPRAALDALAGRLQINADLVHPSQPLIKKALLDAAEVVRKFQA